MNISADFVLSPFAPKKQRQEGIFLPRHPSISPYLLCSESKLLLHDLTQLLDSLALGNVELS